VVGELGAADGIDAAVKAMKAAGAQAVANRLVGIAEPAKLAMRDDSVLAAYELPGGTLYV
jgi:hypothetical protein